MQRLTPPSKSPVSFELDGEAVEGRPGEPIACALLAAGERIFSRSIKYHRPRGPFCMAGSCSQCLMRVDGVPNVFTCRAPVRPHAVVERQNAYPSARADALEAVDWMFPRGMDHHRLFAGLPIAEEVMKKVARQLAGLGLLPARAAPEPMPCEVLRAEVAIVGAGASGLAAARGLLAHGRERVVVLEREAFLGGRLAAGAQVDAPALTGLVELGSERAHLSTTAIGRYRDDGGPFLAAVAEGDPPRLFKVYSERFLFCTGGHPQLWAFENNDLPGVLAGQAVSRLLRIHGLRPDGPLALAGTGSQMRALSALLASHGVPVAARVDLSDGAPGATVSSAPALRAHGRHGLTGISFRNAEGKRARIDCATLAICLPPAPRFELAVQAGAEVAFLPDAGVFAVKADAEGRAAEDVWVAGSARGPVNSEQAAASGERAAQSIARSLP